MTEAYELGRQYTVHLGRSFSEGGEDGGAGDSPSYHTLRYDFKPASLNRGRSGRLTVATNGAVTVQLHHGEDDGGGEEGGGQAAAASVALFTGSQKTCTKECVLLFDRATNTFTLERLMTSVNLKRTRLKAAAHKVAPNHLPTKAERKKRAAKTKPRPAAPTTAPTAPTAGGESKSGAGKTTAADATSPSDAGIPASPSRQGQPGGRTPVADRFAPKRKAAVLNGEDTDVGANGAAPGNDSTTPPTKRPRSDAAPSDAPALPEHLPAATTEDLLNDFAMSDEDD